jgi:hypothetical protein
MGEEPSRDEEMRTGENRGDATAIQLWLDGFSLTKTGVEFHHEECDCRVSIIYINTIWTLPLA